MDCDLWPTPSGVCVNGCTIPEDTDEDLLNAASVKAGVILYTLSGHRVGQCVDVVRPLQECGCRHVCTCSDAGDRVSLYSVNGPITGVSAVLVDGVEVDPAEYRFYPSGQILYRTPPDVWPRQDRKWADCGDPDTMCVQVLVGNAPDAWALDVHAELTCELLKACTGEECRIPTNATSVTGQGITITLSATELKQFIPSVAGWVAAVNPKNATDFAKIYSPDLMPKGPQGAGIPGGTVDPFPWGWDIDGGGP